MDKQIKKLSEQLVMNGLHKELLSAGFAHKGRNYFHRVGSVVQVINVQFSRLNYGSERGFFVNVAFAFDEYRNFFAIPINETPLEYISEFSHRLEYMVPNTPHEWVMNPGANVEGLTNLLQEFLADRDRVSLEFLKKLQQK